MTQTAVVFGATGLVGKELIFELLGNNTFIKVIAVVRNILPVSHSKIEQLVINDFTKLHEYKDKLNADVYFCCIGTTIKIAGSQEAFRKVDFDIPVFVAQLAQELSVNNLVVISSIGANAAISNFYLRTKGEMEKNVRQTFSGNLKIVRPSLLMGHRAEYRLGEKVATVLMKTVGALMVGSLKKYRGIFAWDLARAMIKATTLPKEVVILESDELQNLAGRNNTNQNPHEVIK